MTARRSIVIVGTAVVAVVAVALAASASAETADPAMESRERPRGALEDCRGISGLGAGLRDYRLRKNLVVGPLAVLHAGRTLGYAISDDGIFNKLFVVVKGGHRVTLELSRSTHRDAGFASFGSPQGGGLRQRVVTFISCRRGEWPPGHIPDGWPVSGWVGFLLASSPRCVPLLVWVDDEPRPRRAVIRFGVPDCG